MKIDIAGGYNVYRKNISGEKSVKSGAASSSKKTADAADVSEISRGNTALTDTGLTSLKAKLQSEINLPASAERIERIKTAVKDGTYRIPTEVLVDSILSE